MASITEIARTLNVSPASVSRALNGQPGLADATRARILAEVERLNFVPHGPARSLASTRTENVGFAICDAPGPIASDPFYSRIMLGAEQELRRQGFHLLLTSLEEEQITRPEQWSVVRGRRVDGLILAGPFIPQRFILAMHRQGMPLVLVDNAISNGAIDVVLGDDHEGARMIAEHILGHGKDRIVILSGPDAWITSHLRAGGFVDALRQAGVEPLAILRAEATTYETGRRLLREALPYRPTAILAINDAMAMGAIDAARAAGLNVPDALTVTGFDDVEAAERFEVPLTTVCLPMRHLGCVAARRVLERIAEPDAPQQRTLIALTLTVRRSCGCNVEEGR